MTLTCQVKVKTSHTLSFYEGQMFGIRHFDPNEGFLKRKFTDTEGQKGNTGVYT